MLYLWVCVDVCDFMKSHCVFVVHVTGGKMTIVHGQLGDSDHL